MKNETPKPFSFDLNYPLLPQLVIFLVLWPFSWLEKRRQKNALQEMPPSALERAKEAYALGQIDIRDLEKRIEYELYIDEHAVLPLAPSEYGHGVGHSMNIRDPEIELRVKDFSFDNWRRSREDQV